MEPPPFSSFFQRLYLSHKLIELIHSSRCDISVKRVCTLGSAGLYMLASASLKKNFGKIQRQESPNSSTYQRTRGWTKLPQRQQRV